MSRERSKSAEIRLDGQILQEAVDFFAQAESDLKDGYKEFLTVLEAAAHGLTPDKPDCGLEIGHIEALIAAITDWTSRQYSTKEASEKSKTRRGRRKRMFVDSCSNVFGLNATSSSRLISCLVPKDIFPSGLAPQSLLLWTLTNRYSLGVRPVIEPVLRWTNCLLHYSLCPVEDLQKIYELLIQSLDIRATRPFLYDLLYKLTGNDKRLVTSWRVRLLLHHRAKFGINPTLEHLLHKCQQLRPDLVTITLSKKAQPAKLRNGQMEKSFAAAWAEKAPTMFQEGGLSARLTLWGTGPSGSLLADQSNKLKRLCLVPAVEEAIQGQPAEKRARLEEAKTLHECKTVGDLVKHLPRLQGPAQAMSLIGSPQTFCLIMLNPSSVEMQERLSLTLYHILHNEFFSMTRTVGHSKRKKDLLCRVNQLQDWLQQGIPVVGRFLAQYLAVWNGKDFFLEILKLVVYLQLTDFGELNDLILSPLRTYFNSTYSCMEQLLVLTYLNKLCLHWASVEYERCKNSLNGPFPTANTSCDDPLASIAGLTDAFGQLTESGLCQLVRKQKIPMDAHRQRTNINIYMNEVLSMYMTLSRCLILKEIPVRAQLPAAVVYFSLFGSSSVFLSRSLEYLTMTKHETIPLCHRKAKELENEGDHLGKEVALKQVENLDLLNACTKDALAVLATEKYLTRGESLFRQHWELDEEHLRKNLCIVSHPALLPYVQRFVKEFGSQNKLESEVCYRELMDEHSYAHEKFWSCLVERVPRVTEFCDTFYSKVRPSSSATSPKMMSDSRSRASQNSLAESVATSGVSSMKPSTRSHRRKK